MVTTRTNTPRQLVDKGNKKKKKKTAYANGGPVEEGLYDSSFYSSVYNEANPYTYGYNTNRSNKDNSVTIPQKELFRDTGGSLVRIPTESDLLSTSLSNLPEQYKDQLQGQFRRAQEFKLAQQALNEAKETVKRDNYGRKSDVPYLNDLDKAANKRFESLVKERFGNEPDYLTQSRVGKGALPITINRGNISGNYYKYGNPENLGDFVDTGEPGVLDTVEDYTWLHGLPESSDQLMKDVQARHTVSNKKGWASKLASLGKVIPAVAGAVMAPGIGGALGTGLGVSSATGTALAGAGFGAVGGAATGGDLESALLGAALGGAGGYVKGAGGLSNALGVDPGAVSRLPDGTWVKAVDTGNAIASVEPSLLEKALYTTGSSTDRLSGLSKALSAYSALNSGGTSPQQQQAAALNYVNSLRNRGDNQKPGKGGLSPLSLYQMYGKGYAGGGKVKGLGDGMSDDVPAVIGGETPAALSDGEYVTPALQVSLLGRGSNDAGSKRLEEIIDREIRKMYGKGMDAKALQKKAMK